MLKKVKAWALINPKGEIARYVVDGGEVLLDIVPYPNYRQLIPSGFKELEIEISLIKPKKSNNKRIVLGN